MVHSRVNTHNKELSETDDAGEAGIQTIEGRKHLVIARRHITTQ